MHVKRRNKKRNVQKKHIKMKLPSNFELNKYGLHVRFVNENDAEFIVKLRTNPKLCRFIHSTDDNVEKQKVWIRNYKLREKDGLDYYFIYFDKNIPIGLNRICCIEENSATGASQVCKINLPIELPIISVLINREIFFEILDIPLDIFDVRKGNIKVQKMHKLLGAKIIQEDDINFYYNLTKDDYLKHKPHFLKLLNLTSK